MVKRLSKLRELNNVFSENGISADTIELNDDLIFEIRKLAGMVKDYRHESYARHILSDVIMITFLQYLQVRMNGRKLRFLPSQRKYGLEDIWNCHMEYRPTTQYVLLLEPLIHRIFIPW